MAIAHRTSRPAVTLRIAIGRPGRPPKKLDYFEVTSAEVEDGQFPVAQEIMAALPPKPKRLPIRLLDNDLSRSFDSRYNLWARTETGVTCFCTGDGERALRTTSTGKRDIPCRPIPSDEAPPRSRQDLLQVLRCPKMDDPWSKWQCAFAQNRLPKAGFVCSLHTRLFCGLDLQATVGGVARFQSNGKRTHDKLLGSLELIQRITGGQIEGLPIDLVWGQETTQYMDENGRAATTKVPVVHAELRIAMADVLAVAAARAADRHQLVESVTETRKLLAAAVNEPLDGEVLAAEFPVSTSTDVGTAFDAPSGALREAT